jgi:hypothetical protein
VRIGSDKSDHSVFKKKLSALFFFIKNPFIQAFRTYLKIAPKTITTVDDAQRQAVTQQVLGLYMQNCITFALCQQKTCLAINKGIDMNSIKFAISTGAIRWMDLKWA